MLHRCAEPLLPGYRHVVDIECQRIPLAFRKVLPLKNLELANDNHLSYIIKETFEDRK